MGSISQRLCSWNILIPGLDPGKGEAPPLAHYVSCQAHASHAAVHG